MATAAINGNNLISENGNWVKIATRIIHSGTKALLNLLHGPHGIPQDPEELNEFLCENKKKKKLQHLKSRRIIRQDQWDLLFPQSDRTNSNTFDITLLKILTRYFVTIIDEDSELWDANKLSSSLIHNGASIIVNIVDLADCRNKLMHNGGRKISLNELNGYWNKLTRILLNLNYDDNIISTEILNTPLDQLDQLEKYQSSVMQSQIDALKTIIDGLTYDVEESTANLKYYQCDSKMLQEQVRVINEDVTANKKKIDEKFQKVENIPNIQTKLNDIYGELKLLQSHYKNSKKILCENETSSEAKAKQLHEEQKEYNRKVLESQRELLDRTENMENLVLQIHERTDIQDKINPIYSNPSLDMTTASEYINNIQKLVLHCNQPTNSSVVIIKELEINQQQNLLTDEISNMVYNFKQDDNILQHLDLSTCNLTDREVTKLIKIIPFIDTVKLCNNPNISAEGWLAIADHYLENLVTAKLHHFDISGNVLNDKGLKNLVSMFPHIEKIKITTAKIKVSIWKLFTEKVNTCNNKLNDICISSESLSIKEQKQLLALIMNVQYLCFCSTELNELYFVNLFECLKPLPKPWSKFGINIKRLEYRNCIFLQADFRVLNLLIEIEKIINVNSNIFESICKRKYLKYKIKNQGKIKWKELNLHNHNILSDDLLNELRDMFIYVKPTDDESLSSADTY